jgi:hypothetical protein
MSSRYDPFTGAVSHVKDWKSIFKATYDVIRRCVAENEKRGKTGDERFYVCAILRDNPNRHGWLNLTTHNQRVESLVTKGLSRVGFGGAALSVARALPIAVGTRKAHSST